MTKVEIDIEKLDYTYIRDCSNEKDLEKIVKVLRSGQEGCFPELESCAEERLRSINPSNRLLIVSREALNIRQLPKEDRLVIEDDLDKWSEQMEDSEGGCRNELPPVRNAATIDVTGKRKANKVPTESGSSVRRPIDCTFDYYKKWDSFDVDAEEAKVDSQSAKQQPGSLDVSRDVSVAVTKDGLTSRQIVAAAAKEKVKGNEAFSARDFNEALVYYTRSLAYQHTCEARNNRALVHIKLEKFKEAVADCSHVLKEEPANAKALLRRGVAYKSLEKLDDSMRDYKKLLKLEPGNKVALKAIEDVTKAISKKKSRGRRMVIEEIEDDEGNVGDAGDTRKLIEGLSTLNETERSRLASEEKIDGELTNLVNGEARKVLSRETISPATNNDDSAINFDELPDGKKTSNRCSDSWLHNGIDVISDDAVQEKDRVKTNVGVHDVPNRTITNPVDDSSTVPKDDPVRPQIPPGVMRAKDAANGHHKAGQYWEAVTEFSSAIDAFPTVDTSHDAALAVLHVNRASCYHAIGQCDLCIEDATRAIELSPRYAKAYTRRAQAYNTIEKYWPAYRDFETATTLQPSNAAARDGYLQTRMWLKKLYGNDWMKEESIDKGVATDVIQCKMKSKYNQLRLEGNGLVRQQRYYDAIKYYTECIRTCPKELLAYINRGFCYLKTDMYADCIADCNVALKLSPGNIKASYRKAKACMLLNHLDEAKETLSGLDDDDAKKLLETVMSKIQAAKPLMTPVESTSRRKVEIIEVDDDTDDVKKRDDQSFLSNPLVQSLSEMVEEASLLKPTVEADPPTKVLIEELGECAAQATSDHVPKDKTAKANTRVVTPQGSAGISDAGVGGDRNDDGAVSAGKRKKRKRKNNKSSSFSNDDVVNSNSGDVTTTAEDSGEPAMTSRTSSTVPRNGGSYDGLAGAPSATSISTHEFGNEWALLKNGQDYEAYAKLLLRVAPDDLRLVFSTKLDDEMLSTVAVVLAEHVAPDSCLPYLTRLAQVERFDIVALMMSSDDKRYLNAAFAKISGSEQIVSRLKAKFGL